MRCTTRPSSTWTRQEPKPPPPPPPPAVEYETISSRAVAPRFEFVARTRAREDVDIRVRFPAEDRTLSTLDELKMPTDRGLVPLSNFIEREAKPKLGEIQRIDGSLGMWGSL